MSASSASASGSSESKSTELRSLIQELCPGVPLPPGDPVAIVTSAVGVPSISPGGPPVDDAGSVEDKKLAITMKFVSPTTTTGERKERQAEGTVVNVEQTNVPGAPDGLPFIVTTLTIHYDCPLSPDEVLFHRKEMQLRYSTKERRIIPLDEFSYSTSARAKAVIHFLPNRPIAPLQQELKKSRLQLEGLKQNSPKALLDVLAHLQMRHTAHVPASPFHYIYFMAKEVSEADCSVTTRPVTDWKDKSRKLDEKLEQLQKTLLSTSP